MKRRVLSAVAVGILLMALLGGCAPASDAPVEAEPPTLPDVTSDYEGWTVTRQLGPSRTNVIAGPDAPLVREDVAYALSSPDGAVKLLAWYGRSSRDGETTGWLNPDELFLGDDWGSPRARALHEWMRKERPDESLLGAYQEGAGSSGIETWHVGFFVENPNGSWVRGDHLLGYDSGAGTWTMLADDSGSENLWNITGTARTR